MRYRDKILCTAAAGGVLTLLCFLSAWYGRDTIWVLERPAYGEGDREEQLQVQLEEGRYTVELLLLETPLSREEALGQLSEAADGLETMILNSNIDLDHIQNSLYLPSEIPGTQIQVQWYLDSWELITPDGTLHNEGLREERRVRVQAVLSLQDERISWERELVVCPPDDPDPEQKIRMLLHQIREAQAEEGEEVHLPETVQGEPVSWYSGMDDRWLYMGLLTAAAAGALALGKKQEEDRRIREQERSMQMDYPDIVSRLSLYMAAGMSTRRAWERVVDSYEHRTQKEIRPAYEEMRTALREMQSGVPETAAYERFGMRCRIPAYLKLGTLLGQNLRRGNRDLARLLEEESREAFEDRKALAKKLGEECAGKLLFPMLLLLVTVLVMVMYPAAASFRI